MPKPSTPAVWASGKTFSFQPSSAQQAQGFDYIAGIRPGTGAPITDDHDWPLNSITTALKWVMDQINSDGLKSAAFRDVGIGSGNIPDMSYFQSTLTSSGSIRLPGGYLRQWGVATGNPTGDFSITYNVAFSSKPLFIGFGYKQSALPTLMQSVIVNEATNANTGFSGRAYQLAGGASGVAPSQNEFYWVAEGRI